MYVTAVVGEGGRKELVAAVSPASVDIAAVLAHCRSVLPSAAVPLVQPVDAMTRLPSGKLNVGALGLNLDLARITSMQGSPSDSEVSVYGS